MEPLHLTLERISSGDQGTFGILGGSGLELVTAELPWRDNMQDISCIPSGTYDCAKHTTSQRFPLSFIIQNVPGRTSILFHHGNWAGDTEKRLRADSSGCILVGLSKGELDGQEAVLDSTKAMLKLAAWAGDWPFKLTILERFE